MKVCKRLEAVSASLAKSAQRYEATIELLDETVKVCERAEETVKKVQKKRARELSEGFRVIVGDMRRAGLFRPGMLKDPRKPWK